MKFAEYLVLIIFLICLARFLLRLWFYKPTHRSYPSQGNMGLNIFGFEMFGDGCLDFIHIAGNQG